MLHGSEWLSPCSTDGASRPGSLYCGCCISADVEVESQKKIYDEWGHFVARADLWVVGTVVSMSTTARRTAAGTYTVRILLVSGA